MKHPFPSPILAAALAALFTVSALADKTTNTFTKASNTTPITWANAGLPDITTSAGSDISIKIEYAEGYEKYQELDFPDVSASSKAIYLDSVIGGKYHNLYMTKGQIKYATVNDPSPFEGFWSLKVTMADSGSTASGIYLPDVGSTDVRSIGSVYTKGRFEFGVAPGCEAVLDYPFGFGMFEVNRSSSQSMKPASLAPTGKLTVLNSPGPYSLVRVRNGTLGIVGDGDDTSSPVPGAWARFDASAENSFTFNGTAITQWRDADGRPVSANKANGSPTLFTDSETGKMAVNFGSFVNYSGTPAGNSALHGVGSKLQLSENRDDVAEMFVVFKDNDTRRGTYPAIAGDAFPRRSDPGASQLFKPWASLPVGLSMGEFRLDGQAVIPDLQYDLSRCMHVVSASYRSGGGTVGNLAAPDNDGHENRTRGGIKISEIIFYTNALTSAERRHNNEYLMKKWFGHGVRDYGAIMLDNSASLSVTSGTARVREVVANSLAKAGAGILEVETLGKNLNSLTVSDGGVRFANTLARPTSPQPAADPLAWFDADDSASFDTFVSNYNDTAYTFVTSWRDKRSNGYTLARKTPGSHANYANGADEAAYPTLDTSTGTKTMVDLGPWTYQVDGNFGWVAGTSGLSTWLCLYTNGVAASSLDSSRQGFVVFYKTNSRGNPINSSNWYLRNGTRDVPSQMFVETGHGHGAAVGGHWTYDGVTIDPTSVSITADGKAHLASFQFADVALPVDVFGADMGIGGGGAGGC